MQGIFLLHRAMWKYLLFCFVLPFGTWYPSGMERLSLQLSLPVMVLREGDAFVAHTPVLDLSTTGSTLEEAQKNFVDAVNFFLEEATAMGTLDDVLSDMGWKRKDRDWVPPVVVAHGVQTFQFPLA